MPSLTSNSCVPPGHVCVPWITWMICASWAPPQSDLVTRVALRLTQSPEWKVPSVLELLTSVKTRAVRRGDGGADDRDHHQRGDDRRAR